jgi:hypothetical protein
MGAIARNRKRVRTAIDSMAVPPLPVITNVISCHVKGTLANGRQWVNGYHVLKPSASSVAAAIAAIDPILLALYNVAHTGGGVSILAQMPTSSNMVAIYYLPLDGTSATTIVSHSLSGGAAGDALPASATLTVTSQTGQRGRDKRGRVFLPPFIEADNDATGKPGATQVTQLQTQFDKFLLDMTTATMLPVVASYKHASQAIITNYVVRSQWASRRKRLGRPV